MWDALCVAYAQCLRNCGSEDDVLELDGWVTVTAAQAGELAEDERHRRMQMIHAFAEVKKPQADEEVA